MTFREDVSVPLLLVVTKCLECQQKGQSVLAPSTRLCRAAEGTVVRAHEVEAERGKPTVSSPLLYLFSHPEPQWVSLPQLNLSGNILTDKPRDESLMILNLVELTQ